MTSFGPQLTGRQLRRQLLRATSKKPTRPRSNRLHSVNSTGGLLAIDRSSSYSEERAASLSNEARMSWHHLCNGSADLADFDNLAYVFNVCEVVAAQKLGGAAIPVAEAAQNAMANIKERYFRSQKLGPDAQALRDIPPALDLYDAMLSVMTPLQLTRALEVVIDCVADLKNKKDGQA